MKRPGFKKVMAKAAATWTSLGVAGTALVAAAALGSWPILAIGGAAYAALFFSMRGKSSDKPADTPVGTTAPPVAPKDRVTISLLYSTEKKEWVEAVVAEFQKAHPEIQVDLVGKGSIDAAQDIIDDKAKPTLWSPADSLILHMAMDDWETKTRKPLFPSADEDAPQPLVISPLVFAIWEDRADVLLKASGGAVSWKALRKAIVSNQGWPAIGGKEEWGFVKLGHTNPTRSNSGLQALLFMAFEFYGKRTGVEVADLLKPDFQAFVKDIEKGVTKFETSTGTFMTDMIRFGPSSTTSPSSTRTWRSRSSRTRRAAGGA